MISLPHLHPRWRPTLLHLSLLTVSVGMLTFLGSVLNVMAGPTFAPTASVSLDLSPSSFIGEEFALTVTFDNIGSDPGYGPFIDLILPYTGVDGLFPFEPGYEADGIDFIDSTYLGISLTSTVLPFPDTPSCVDHPYAVDSSGVPIQVCGTPGDRLVVIQLPFGSFVVDQPAVDVNVDVSLSAWADLGVALEIQARGGYQFGQDPLDNPGSDPSILGSFTSRLTTPSLITLDKTYLGPEDETATGPNFPRQYTLTADIAAGQPITDLNITDFLPNNMAFLNVISTLPGGSSIDQLPTIGLAANPPNNDLMVSWAGPITGTAGSSDATVTFEYFIPRDDANASTILDPSAGDDVPSENNTQAGGTWDPVDPRDEVTSFSTSVGTVDHVLTDKSIAIQKGVEIAPGLDVGASGFSPGDTLQYTLEFQISDYFTFGDLRVTDVFSDGQRLDGSFPPTLSVSDRSGSRSGVFTAGDDLTIDLSQIGNNPDPATNGSTRLVFNVSAAILNFGASDGILQGGRTITPDAGPAVGTIVYRTIIQEAFSDTYPSGDASVDHGDKLRNDMIIFGTVRDNNSITSVLGDEEDDSGASVVIERGRLEKTIYAVRGSVCSPQPCTSVQVAPGDTVTYRIYYTLPSSDFEDLYFIDYLPLPIFDATSVTVFDAVLDGTAPDSGRAKFGPADTFYNSRSPASNIVPAIETSGPANSVKFTYGDYDDPTDSETAVDILFTVTVTDDPFADGLFLTNQVRGHEGSTNADDQDADSIVQIQITEPVLNITKGVVYTDNGAGNIDPALGAPISFVPGSCPAFSGGTINSTYLDATPLDGDLSGVDAGDTVMLAIVIENTGRGLNGAFDVQVRDSLPTGLDIADFVSGSLCVTDGAGDPIAYTELGGGGETDLFGAGIELVDPGPTNPPAGALDPGKDGAGLLVDTGRNIAIISYALILPSTVEPLQDFTNTATLFNYAGVEGGEDHTATDLSDDATITIAPPEVEKVIIATDQAHTANEPPPPPQVNVVIGEIITYEATITVPEGTTSDVDLQDQLDTGLAFVDCVSITASLELATDIGSFSDACNDPVNPTVTYAGANNQTNQGRLVTFDFGAVTNSDSDNASDETIVVTYQVVVINGGSNDGGDQRNNQARWRWSDTYVQASAPNVRIYEPAMDVVKTASPDTGDAGDEITFSLTIDHVGSAYDIAAFDLELIDPIPEDTTLVIGSLNCNAPGTTLSPDSCAIGGSPETLTVTWDDFPLGQATVIEFRVTLDSVVTPGQVIPNNADLAWTSLPVATLTALSDYNSLSYERTGDETDPGLLQNDYATRGSDTVTITNPGPVKSIVITSESHTPDTTADTPADPRPLTIGEIIRYRMQVSIPEGTNPNVLLTDTLPDGLTLFEDDTIRIALIADNDITEAADLAGADNDADPPDFTLPDSRLSVLGQTLTLDLGTLINNDSDGDVELILVEFNALVVNTADNNRGDGKANSFSVEINAVDFGISNVVNAEIVEPELQVNKVADPITGDAGDEIEFTVLIDHAAGSNTDAFNLDFIDILPADYTLDLGSVSVSPSTGVTDTSTGNTISLRIDDLALAESVTITYTATLDTTVTPDQVLTNTGQVTWTSLPGEQGTEINPTGSSVSGDSGASDGERTGEGGVNDYVADDDASVTIQQPQFIKEIVDTSQAGTGQDQHDPTLEDLTIGETVTFRLSVTLPEGTNPSIAITDDLPDVITLESACIESIGGNLSGAGLPTERCPTESGTKNDVNFPDGLPDQVTFEFGTIDNNPDGVVSEDDRIVVEVVGLVRNVSQNENGDLLTNTGTLRYGTSTTTAEIDVEVVEPDLIVTKQADDDTPAFNQIVTYTITVEHSGTSTADAHDLVIKDTIPTGLTYISGSSSMPPAQVDESGYPPQVVYTIPSLMLVAGSTSFTYQAQVGDPSTVSLGDELTNGMDLIWTSLSDVDEDERTGDDAGGAEPQNDYLAQADESVFVTGPDLRIEKDDGGVTVGDGEVIIYTLNFYNDGNSVAVNTVIEDVVPQNTTFNEASSSAGWSCSDGDPAGIACRFTPDVGSGAGILPAGASGSVDFAVLMDSPLPAGVDQVDNLASISYDDASEPDPTPGNNQDDDFTPVSAAPDLVITKDDGLDTVSPGTILIFTITFSNVGDQGATGVELTDVIPDDTTFNEANSSAGWSCTDGDLPGTTCTYIPDIGYGSGQLPAGEGGSISFALNVDDPFPVGEDSVTNRVRIEDDGANGSDPTPENNEDDDTDNVVTLENADIEKDLVNSNQAFTIPPDVAIGEILTYEVVLTIPPGTMRDMTVTDVLDRGLAFLRCVSITPSSGNLTTTLVNGFSDACDADPANPLAGNPVVSAEPASGTDAQDQGRRIKFDFEDVSNAGAIKETLTIAYEVVVLDNGDNLRGINLNNTISWEWVGGGLQDGAENVTILEPSLSLSKSAAPRVVLPGASITFTLTLEHDGNSDTDAFDLELEDVVPTGLEYVQGSLQWTGEGVQPTTIDDSAAPNLLVTWADFPLGSSSEIQFRARMGNLRPGTLLWNSAFLRWSSLPGDVSDPQSDFNDLAKERDYDPPSDVDVYGVMANASIQVAKLPDTGFPPDRVTPITPPAKQVYLDLGGYWLEIPDLGVRSSIIGVRTDETGWDLTWLWDRVGYLEGTAFPTLPGNTALTAHVFMPDGTPGPFERLSDLRWGDEILIHAGQQIYRYEVREVRHVWPTDLSPLKHESHDWITLITCEGYDEAQNLYRQRVVVRAVLMKIE